MNEFESMSAKDLMQRMMALEFYLIKWIPLVSFEQLLPVLKEHFVYLIGLEKEGVLFASGPLEDKAEGMTGEGVTIVRANGFEVAEKIAKDDPFVKAGLRKYTIHKWTANEGRISISVDLSDGTPTLM